MKKILMVCEAFGGGVFTYVSWLCNNMCDEYDIYLAYSLRPQTPSNYMDFLNPKVHCRPIIHCSGNLLSVADYIGAIQELQALEAEIRPDIIHLHSSIAGGLGRLAFSGKENVLVYTPHGYAHILMGRCIKSRMYAVMEWILGRKNCITLTCCKSEDEAAKKVCKKTAYIETGINTVELDAALDGIHAEKKEGFTVYALGRICRQKRPDLFNRIAQLVPEARFIWIGSGELADRLTSPNIEVTGWKARKDALAMAKGADAFLLCSMGEAVAMSLLESMYMKKLVLVSNVMGNKSVIQDRVNGYICEKAEEYAERIKEAMRQFPRELPERAYRDVLEVYNADVMKKKYVQFYSALNLGGYEVVSIPACSIRCVYESGIHSCYASAGKVAA